MSLGTGSENGTSPPACLGTGSKTGAEPGTAGCPRHWFPTFFSDKDPRKMRTPVVPIINDQQGVYKPEGALRRAAGLAVRLKEKFVSNANHMAEYATPIM
jgi:hypothetical protein